MLPPMPLRMTRADYDAAQADISLWPWLDASDGTTFPGYRLWFLNGPEEVTCPCCGRKEILKGWEWHLLDGVRKALTAPPLGNGWAERPQRVVCIDGHGHRLCKGWAQVYRIHGGLIDLWVSIGREDYRLGRWHPVERVLWEVEEAK